MGTDLVLGEGPGQISNNTAPESQIDLAPPLRQLPRQLSRRQKAAIIVRLLLAEGAELALQDLPDSLQGELVHQMSTMRYVDRATLKAVIDEFVFEIEEVGLSFPGGLEDTLSVLDGTISPATAARVRKLSGVQIAHDPWSAVSTMTSEQLLPLLENESPEVSAVLLSKLKTSLAAELLGKLPGQRARKIAYAVSMTGTIAPDVVSRIGRSLAEQLGAQPPRAFEDDPSERVGSILNVSPAATREEVLDGLEEEDTAFASAVRKSIFTFANIPERLQPGDVPKVTKDIDQAVLVTALAAATGDQENVANFILDAMSKRLAEGIREEMAERSAVKPAEGDAAMNEIIAQIRTLETGGEITLIVPDEDE
ncbi:flagellar motor switch protein FliG [Aliiroseovarius halocynthiae]|uniref:Flagellar motor switch protein FliG n=2 Tax=Aliiroseovarius halocynthiae TaxID=985055 RepID=A0A545SX40_9RHOB|nr:FliG C-terminal domain-containing protein [Aliiroseovarius halocynthiae]TQV69531.1 flagellar motor switch protein FliG [Aliiroseovarius halocynthiae]